LQAANGDANVMVFAPVVVGVPVPGKLTVCTPVEANTPVLLNVIPPPEAVSV
jgi:hypothetical protein